MTEDNAKDDAKSSDDAPTEEEALREDMEEFVLALNRFVHLVEGMDWPDNFQLAKDQQHCFHVFRTFWRQRMRQRRENTERGRHDDVRFQGMSKEDVRRFFRNRFS